MRFDRLFVVAVALACAIAVAPFSIAYAADPPAVQAIADCAGILFVTTEKDNGFIVRAVDLPGPFTGTIAAYGANRMSTGEIGRAALVNLPYGGREASVVVRADGPIDGIEYAPAWSACRFHAVPLPRGYIEESAIQRPALVLGSSQPAAPVSCAHPYVSPTVTHAVEPFTPRGAEARGVVRVAVALDARGGVHSARVLNSPSGELNSSAVWSATQSEYTGAIFRCAAVPGAYPFAVEYN